MSQNPLIRGTDGAVPQYDPNSRWTTWAMHELYLGADALNKYVPKIKDHVRDLINNRLYEVTAISDLLVPSFKDITDDAQNLDQDILISPSTGRTSETYRVYYDKTTIPYTLSVDARVKVAGSMSTFARIFRGSDTSTTGEILSMIYDHGQYLDDKVNLELASYDSHDVNNHTIKSIPPCFTNKDLKNGELVTIVIYDSVGKVIYKKAALIENTTFIRAVNADQKYVSHIAVRTPFMDVMDTSLIKYPINVPVASLNMYGQVYYSDGSMKELAVDGSKFKMLGLESFVATTLGQSVPLVLRYRLDQNEAAYGNVSVDGQFVTQPYKLLTTAENGVYTPKLYAYPEWNNDIQQYILRWFMMDLKRDILVDVTNYVLFNDSSDVWSGNRYNVVQNLSVRINLHDVSAAMPDYIHTQTISIVLRRAFTEEGTKYEIAFDPNQTTMFGTNLQANCSMVNQNLWRVQMNNNSANLLEWLEKLYFSTRPLFNIRREDKPMTPTHFSVVAGGQELEYSLDAWDKEIQVSVNLDLLSNIYIQFLHKSNNQNLKLSIAALPVYRVT